MNAVCEVCGAIGYEHLLLCCHDCKGAHVHQYCLDRVVFDASLEHWFCDECKQRHNEGSHSRSLEKVSSERPSNHAECESISLQPITTGINFTAPAPPLSPATGITQDLSPTGRKVLAPVRCQDFHSMCSLEAETGGLAVSLPSHVPSKEITNNQLDLEHDPATFLSLSLPQITDTAGAVTKRIVENFQKVLPILEKGQVAMTEKAAQNDTLKAKNDVPQCQALQNHIEEKPGLRSQVKALGDVETALRSEKAELEAELKSARSELEKCQIEVKFLRERIQTLEEKEVAWLGSEERHKAAITAFKVERDKMIRDKSVQDSEIKTFHVELKKLKSQVESYKSQVKAALEKKATVDNEGSYSWSLGKVSSERPSNHAQFDSISQHPITARINCAAPAPPRSPATGITITQDLGLTGRKALAPIRCQDFHSACSIETETGVSKWLQLGVQSKVITHNPPAPGCASQEQGRRLREGPDRVWHCADGHGDTKTSVGSSEMNKELTFEQVSRHFSMPLQQAAREMNVGVTFLKKQCRKLGIMRWPHRKVKSLQTLIDNVQELGEENAQENGHLSRSLVGFMQQRPNVMRTEELRQVCFNENNNAQEDGDTTRSVVEFLQLTKKMMIERPDMTLDERTNRLRQACFKETYKRKRS